MNASGSYHASTRHRDLETEIQRLHAQARLSWEKEARTLARFGLRDGMSVLELGSGPGFISEALLTMLPNSVLTALEVDPVLIERAEEYLQGKTPGRLHIVEASIMDMGMADNTFDFAVARLIFQHLPDPYGAASEILRVLKPSGKLAIIDVDIGNWMVFDPPNPHFQTILNKYEQMQVAQGGSRRVGRRMLRILKGVGFQNIDIEAVVAHSDVLGMDAFLPQIDPDQLLPLVTSGLLTEKELGAVRSAEKAFLGSSESLIMRILLLASGQKAPLPRSTGAPSINSGR